MCGLIGVIDSSKNGFIESDIDLFMTLMHLNNLRGFDGTGIMVPGNKVAWIKSAKTPSALFRDTAFKQFKHRNLLGNHMVFGHCRAATRGTVSKENAHPFTVGDITLIKNGTINVSYQNDKDFYDWPVDSMWVAHCLNTKDPQEFVSMANGGYAMIWHNKRNKTINFLRNGERPLFFANVVNKARGINQTWIASEQGFINFVAERFDLTVKNTYYFEEYVHYYVSDSDYHFNLKQIKLKAPEKPKSVVVYNKPANTTQVKEKSDTLTHYTYLDHKYYRGSELEMIPIIWKKIANGGKNARLPMFKVEGWIDGDNVGEGPTVTIYMEYEEDAINDILRIKGKVTLIRNTGAGENDVEIIIQQPFLECKADVVRQ